MVFTRWQFWGLAEILSRRHQAPTFVCQTHATAIAANNGSHKIDFDNIALYKELYKFVSRIM